MRKNVIHNFNLSIQNSADIKSSEDLTSNIIKELAKVSKEMSQQKDITQIWQEQKDQNAILNNFIASTEEGANDAFTETNTTAISVSNTSSVFGETRENTTRTSTLFGNNLAVTSTALTGGCVADTIGRTTTNSSAPANNTPPTLGAENNTTQIYNSVAAQQTFKVPQTLQTNSEPAIEVIKEEIKKKLDLAISVNDTVEIEYWNRISKAFEDGFTAKDFDGKPDNILFTEMYAMLKQSNSVIVEAQNFNWEIVRKKMIKAIDTNILKGKISKKSNARWVAIKNQLSDDTINIANLFEQYDELFLLLKEVEGLEDLPTTITIMTKTKIYPNLSVDKMYPLIGKKNIYVFLKKFGDKNDRGSEARKGALKIKNTETTSFVAGEKLDFFLDETFLDESLYKKENIDWRIYEIGSKKRVNFVDQGTSLSYTFDNAGNYKVEVLGTTMKGNKNVETSIFIELNIIPQEIEITPAIKYTRAFTEQKVFKVALKNPEVKTLNPLKLYYQVEFTNAKKEIKNSDLQELDATGIVKLAMPDLGKYKIKVMSKDQYALANELEIKVIKNYVNAIIKTDQSVNDSIYWYSKSNQKAIFKVKSFIIEPTAQEKTNVKWIVYDKDGKIFIPDRLKLQVENNEKGKEYLTKGETFEFPIPKTEGEYTVEAYSNSQDGINSKSASIKKITVKHPQVNEAYWAYSGGSQKQTSGFTGEINHIKASIPGYVNQPVKINFFVNESKAAAYYHLTTTNANGEINKNIVFNTALQKRFGIQNGKTAKIRFELEGIQNKEPYLFKKNANVYNEAVLNVTTKAQIIDAYFMYEDNRITAQDEIPYSPKGTIITIVAKTQNMVGEEIVLTAHKVQEKPSFSGKATVNLEGVATTKFILRNLNKKLKTGTKVNYYVGIEGHSTKHLTDKTLTMIMGIGKTSKKEMIDEDELKLIWGAKVSVEFRKKVVTICKELWGEKRKIKMANQLMICMDVETKGKFTSSVGYPKATGLIQFTETAIADMNGIQKQKNGSLKATGPRYTGPDYKDKLLTKKDLKEMTEIRQLDFVKLYFQMHIERYKRVINNAEDMYMTIFAPIGVGKEDSEVLYDNSVSPINYRENKSADGEYWDKNEYKILNRKKDQKITREEMTPRIKQSIYLGKKYSIEIDETRSLDIVLADKIIKEKKITFSSIHPYRSTNDKANADDNIKDASQGNKVYTSEYGHAKGKQVNLSIGVLYVLHELSKKYKFNVQELAGASHSSTSQHYRGTAIDINIIDDKHVDCTHYNEEFYVNFTKVAKEMGAISVFHPYYSATRSDRTITEERRKELKKGEKLIPKSDHWNHIHIQF